MPSARRGCAKGWATVPSIRAVAPASTSLPSTATRPASPLIFVARSSGPLPAAAKSMPSARPSAAASGCLAVRVRSKPGAVSSLSSVPARAAVPPAAARCVSRVSFSALPSALPDSATLPSPRGTAAASSPASRASAAGSFAVASNVPRNTGKPVRLDSAPATLALDPATSPIAALRMVSRPPCNVPSNAMLRTGVACQVSTPILARMLASNVSSTASAEPPPGPGCAAPGPPGWARDAAAAGGFAAAACGGR